MARNAILQYLSMQINIKSTCKYPVFFLSEIIANISYDAFYSDGINKS